VSTERLSESLVGGIKPVGEALCAPGFVSRVFVAKGKREAAVEAILDAANAQGIPFEFVPAVKLNSLTGSSTHQGVAAKVSPVAYRPFNDWLARDFVGEGCAVVLDQVQHPKNLGMIIRAAAGAGCTGVVLPARGGAMVDEAVVRASAGTVFHIPLVRCGNVAQTLRALREAHCWVYGLDGEAQQDVFAMEWPRRCALVLGNETHGLRHAVAKACDECVRIPLAPRVESLNVAVAAGIALFQVSQARGNPHRAP
jgi:23S rRNA (guanosine2251-2'-O)-methyltransferase